MPTVRIYTTQNVSLAYEAASIGDRIVAALIDIAILVAWMIGVGWLLRQLLPTDYEVRQWVAWVVIGVPVGFYDLACEVLLNGQTVGKKARHLRVVRLDGTAPRLGDFLLRWLLRIIDIDLTAGAIAIITIALNGRGQRLGDLAAGTTVVSLRPQASPLAEVVSAAVPTDYEPVFPQAGQLSDHDISLLRQLIGRSLRRQNYLLLHDTALKVKSLLDVQSELEDEVFLRTVLRDHAHLVAS
ncbi:MAG TPA: RDD family protein [Hymenobacter sp.]|uniref:RDD family protein n=1 Tax=Hymenobacter sp. TaxID=1898978 RepID=UPI002D7EC3FB|nr:RDD family protein [Hymenobacter sp.]HET9502835.1 RDD family protein [Hymenobacter sp.]